MAAQIPFAFRDAVVLDYDLHVIDPAKDPAGPQLMGEPLFRHSGPVEETGPSGFRTQGEFHQVVQKINLPDYSPRLRPTVQWVFDAQARVNRISDVDVHHDPFGVKSATGIRRNVSEQPSDTRRVTRPFHALEHEWDVRVQHPVQADSDRIAASGSERPHIGQR
jgi:hypothetical protein